VASIAVYGRDFALNSDKILNQGPFDHRFLVEGDSWMDRSSIPQLSLAYYLAQELTARGVSALLINISKAGDELADITNVMGGELMYWLQQDTYDGILLSAGGNDFIDAARDPAAGKGLLRNMAGQPLPADGYDCVDQGALTILVDNFLVPNFDKLAKAIRANPASANTPIYLNCYDTPTARNAPAGFGFGPWLYTAYQKNSIDPTLWPRLTAGIFGDVKKAISDWTAPNYAGVTAVPTTGVLTPAAAGTTGSSGDWANEIHPNASGWRKLAKVWATTLGF
jgi:hypothetical protein